MVGGVDGRDGPARFNFRAKKETDRYSARRAEIGARTLKTGQSRCFLGYKKHTFRLWLARYPRGVLLVPLVSWVAPANVSEGCRLRPSVQHCWRRWQWRPDVTVGDMGYIDAASKQRIRERWQAAVVTRLKENLLLVPPFATATTAACPQGQVVAVAGLCRPERRCAPAAGKPERARASSPIRRRITRRCWASCP